MPCRMLFTFSVVSLPSTMMLLSFFVSLAVLAPFSSAALPQVPISVYYESLCPDSVKFFTEQLYPVYKSSVRTRIDLELVPYGKSNYSQDASGEYSFDCHHGPNECYGNKIQACAIKKLTDVPKLMSLLNCLMENGIKDKNGTYPIEICAEKTGVPTVSEIVTCANGTEGSKYLVELGMKTDNLQPKLTSVPTIVVNGTFSDTNQKQAQTNLQGLLCSFLPGDKPSDCAKGAATSLTVTVSALFLLATSRIL